MGSRERLRIRRRAVGCTWRRRLPQDGDNANPHAKRAHNMHTSTDEHQHAREMCPMQRRARARSVVQAMQADQTLQYPCAMQQGGSWRARGRPDVLAKSGTATARRDQQSRLRLYARLLSTPSCKMSRRRSVASSKPQKNDVAGLWTALTPRPAAARSYRAGRGAVVQARLCGLPVGQVGGTGRGRVRADEPRR